MRKLLGIVASLGLLALVVGTMMGAFLVSFVAFQELIPTGPTGQITSAAGTMVKWDGPLAPLRLASAPLAVGVGVLAMYAVQIGMMWVGTRMRGGSDRPPLTFASGLGMVARRPKAWLMGLGCVGFAAFLFYASMGDPYAVTVGDAEVLLHTPRGDVAGSQLEVVAVGAATELVLDGVAHRVWIHDRDLRRTLQDLDTERRYRPSQ